MTQQAEVTFGKITEEGLAKLRAAFGRPYYMIRQNEVASKDAIEELKKWSAITYNTASTRSNVEGG